MSFDPTTIFDDVDETILSDTEREFAATLGRLRYNEELAAITRHNHENEEAEYREATGRRWGFEQAGYALMDAIRMAAVEQIASRRMTELEAELPQIAMRQKEQANRVAAASSRNVVWFARTARGWSQIALAKHLGVAQSIVSRWESGKEPIPDDRRAELARIAEGGDA